MIVRPDPRLRVVSCTAPFLTLMTRLLLAGVLTFLAGCETFDAPPEEAETTGIQTTSGWSKKSSKSAKVAKPVKPGLFKNFRNFLADGTECHASWWTAPELQPDLWERLRKNYQFKTYKNDRVAVQRNWYVKNQGYLNRVSARANRYLYHITVELEKRNMPGELALLPIVESAYNPYAYSTSKASGLWQFIPGTAKHLGMEMNWWYDDRRDVVAATDNALNYLEFLRDHYNGDWLKALAAYNAGWGAIDRAVAKNKAKGLPTDYWNLDVPEETQAYVPKMLALAQISKSPDDYGIYWAYIPDLPYFAEVSTTKQIDIPLAADAVDISIDELYLLNPGLSRWSTPPGKQSRLLVPIDQANDLQEFLANNSGSSLMGSSNNRDHSNPLFKEMESKVAARPQTVSTGSRKYKVQRGDTWSTLASDAGISPNELQKLNRTSGYKPLKVGQTLTLPGKSERVEKTAKASEASNKKTDKIKKTKGKKNTGDATISGETPDNSDSAGIKEKQTGSGSYTVKKGDTLMAISRSQRVSVDDLARWNGINKNKHSLKLGQKIKLQP